MSGAAAGTGGSADASRLARVCVAALGVVYGDIGTSPLYAMRECFHAGHGVAATPQNVYGVLSLIVMALVMIVTVKYVGFVLRADFRGQGGILALLGLLGSDPKRAPKGKLAAGVTVLAVFGAALLYGDGMITPAISVLSAVEGLEYAAPALKPFVIPITVAVLALLFGFQSHGTTKVGGVFGPVMLVWFSVLGLLGLWQVVLHPDVLQALNPAHGFRFLASNGFDAIRVLGSVFLVVTGAEALYADVGHFGRRPIKISWLSLVLPALALNYLGQGALLVRDPQAAQNPFYALVPGWGVYPLVGLATLATVIASQALISGAYSLSLQAIQLGYSPRLHVRHTSEEERGQVYIGQINWLLMAACIALVVGFRSSSNLAAAYGIAVTMDMLITSGLFFLVLTRYWGWRPLAAGALCGMFALPEAGFFAANLLKIPSGGWFALFAASLIFAVLRTWKAGRAALYERLKPGLLPIELFLEDIARKEPIRVPGAAVFLSANPDSTPLALLHNLKHNQVLHETVVLLSVRVEQAPYVRSADNVSLTPLACGFYRVVATFGYMENPDVPALLRRLGPLGLELKPGKTTFFLSRETLVPAKHSQFSAWRRRLFGFLSNNATSAAAFFNLPPGRVVELGLQIEL